MNFWLWACKNVSADVVCEYVCLCVCDFLRNTKNWFAGTFVYLLSCSTKIPICEFPVNCQFFSLIIFPFCPSYIFSFLSPLPLCLKISPWNFWGSIGGMAQCPCLTCWGYLRAALLVMKTRSEWDIGLVYPPLSGVVVRSIGFISSWKLYEGHCNHFLRATFPYSLNSRTGKF